MFGLNKTTFSFTVGLAAGAIFLGYCAYRDQKRLRDPDYKKDAQTRRSRKLEDKDTTIPNLNNEEDLQAYFLQEVKLGDSLIAHGDLEQVAEHWANAIIVSGRPNQFLDSFRSSLPEHFFELLLEKYQQLVVVASGSDEDDDV